MINLFYSGGPLFMGTLTIMLLAMLVVAVRSALHLFKDSDVTSVSDPKLVKSIGLLAMVTGILAQLIGLFDAFSAIEKVGEVSPALLAGGLKVSLITTIYGIVIYLISLIIWLVLKWKYDSKANA